MFVSRAEAFVLLVELQLMRYGFHLASLPHHAWTSVAVPLAEMGFDFVATRVDSSWCSSSADQSKLIVAGLQSLRRTGLEVVIDADGKFLSDPWNIDAPSLSKAAESSHREALLSRWIHLAGDAGATQLTLTAGPADQSDDAESILKRLTAPLVRMAELAARSQVQLALRPAFGTVVETFSHFQRLMHWLPEPVVREGGLGWVADIAVMARRGELPIGDRLAQSSDRLFAVYLSDVATGIAGDMRLGSGDLAIDRILETLADQRFQGPVIFRCEGYADAGLELAREAIRLTSHNGR